MRYRLHTNTFLISLFFFFQAEDGIRDRDVTGVQTCALPIYERPTSIHKTFGCCSRFLRPTGCFAASQTWQERSIERSPLHRATQLHAWPERWLISSGARKRNPLMRRFTPWWPKIAAPSMPSPSRGFTSRYAGAIPRRSAAPSRQFLPKALFL